MPLNIDWQQILLHLFNFAILVGGLYLLLYNPVKKFIKKREEHYVQVDQEAEGKRQEAAELAEQHRVRLQEVDKEIALKKAEAQKEIDSMREEQLAEAQKQAEAILGQAKAAAEQERQEIMDKMGIYMTFGMYAVNTKNPVVQLMKQEVLKVLKATSPAVLSIHGFHVHFEDSRVHFDVVVDFTVTDLAAFRSAEQKALEEAFPTYSFSFNIDPDYA